MYDDQYLIVVFHVVNFKAGSNTKENIPFHTKAPPLARLFLPSLRWWRAGFAVTSGSLSLMVRLCSREEVRHHQGAEDLQRLLPWLAMPSQPPLRERQSELHTLIWAQDGPPWTGCRGSALSCYKAAKELLIPNLVPFGLSRIRS